MFSRMPLSARLLVVTAAILSFTALTVSLSAASPQAPMKKAFHATKDCSGSTGLVGSFCTIRSSNVKAIKVGSRIFYFQAGGKTALNSDVVLYAERGTTAAGHCRLVYATGLGLCTFSDGTGKLAGFQARVRVSLDSKVPKLYHWDGTYSFKR
jgi:hypothetical protein